MPRLSARRCTVPTLIYFSGLLALPVGIAMLNVYRGVDGGLAASPSPFSAGCS